MLIIFFIVSSLLMENQKKDFDVRVTCLLETDCVPYQKIINDLFLDTCQHFIFQLECTDVEGKPNWHFQGSVHLKDRTRPSTYAKLIRTKFPPKLSLHVGYTSNNGLEALKNYCMKKDDTYRLGPWTDKDVARTEEEKILVELKSEYKDVVWKPFQQTIIDSILAPVNKRVINWFYQVQGNVGKTYLCNYLNLYYDIPIMTYSDSRRIIYLVTQTKRSSCYVFDLTKSKPKDVGGQDLYAAMEQIKNGIIFNTFQKPCQFRMKSPHIWVFANVSPNRNMMSRDRWNVYTIDPETNFLVEDQ